MLPEPLATIRTYATEEAAHADLDVLHAANLTAYVATRGHGRGGHTVVLQVIESDVDDALTLLGEPDEFPADEAESSEYACPRCGSNRSTALPPWMVIALVGGCAAVGVPMFLNSWKAAVLAAIVAGWVLNRAEAAPQWRCLNCQFTWKSPSAAERRAAARRAAPE